MPRVPPTPDERPGTAWYVVLGTFLGIVVLSLGIFTVFFIRRRRGASQAATAPPNEKYESRSRGQSMDRLLDSEPPPTHRHTASASDDTSAPYASDNTLAESAEAFAACMPSATSASGYSQSSATSSGLATAHHFPLPLGGQPEPDAVVLRGLQRTPNPVQHVNAKHASVHIVRMLPTVASAPAVPPLPDTYHYQRTPKLSTTSQISADGQAFAATLHVYGHHRLSSVGEKAMAWPETPGGHAYGLDRVDESE
ncbi:hypothetical protein C8J57DRAFT_1517345 [Mycena rebaudengoi]|nr:hypothetical protein C8J57DRAFT_1517345 [Mycena rebaudengoi]